MPVVGAIANVSPLCSLDFQCGLAMAEFMGKKLLLWDPLVPWSHTTAVRSLPIRSLECP